MKATTNSDIIDTKQKADAYLLTKIHLIKVAAPGNIGHLLELQFLLLFHQWRRTEQWPMLQRNGGLVSDVLSGNV